MKVILIEKNVPQLSLYTIARRTLVVAALCVLLYGIEKVGSKNYGAIRANEKPNNWLCRSILRVPSSDDVAETPTP